MLNKKIYRIIVLITLFSFCYNTVYAYEFINSKNESLVNGMISEVYDSKELYEDLAGGQSSSYDIFGATSSSYWWPIGSETTVDVDNKIYAKDEPSQNVITSNFGYRLDPFGSGATKFHSGIDISGPGGNNVINIIAAKDGIVVYPTSEVKNDCPSSTTTSTCGGGYGNYVVIQHVDGNYTLYAHLHEKSITVTAGDSVEQGQVIAKMGSSGNSTGTHLHFEIREGQNAYNATVDPLKYISAENPRVVSTGGDFLNWLNSWEGHTKIDGNYYIVENIGDGVRTVGGGVTLENNKGRFAQYGIDIADYEVGSKIEISIVDQLELEIINEKRGYIENILSKNSITVEEKQIEALISQVYNTGNINGFADNYKKYGNTQDLYDNWFFRNLMRGTKFEAGLTRRRNAEWSLFHLGEYVYNS